MMCVSLPLLFSLCILELRKVTRTKASMNDLCRSTSVFLLCFLFIFAVCLLVLEQYLVKWKCSLGAIAVQETIISARYPAEISFLILFYWKKPFFKKKNSILFIRFCVPIVYETLQVASPLPWWFMIKMIVMDYLLLRWLWEGGLCSFFLHFSKVSLGTQSMELSVLILLNRY